MAFIVGSIIIGAGASLAGAAISSRASDKAGDKAAAGSEREIKYLEESRDIARGDQAPYRTAGYAALDRAGEMTGLLDEGGTFGGSTAGATGQGQALTADGSPWGESPWSLGWDNGYVATLDDGTTQYWNEGTNSWQSSRGSAYGSGGSGGGGGGRQGSNIQQRAGGGPLYPPTIGRAVGGQLYNVNELGAESVYSQGSYTRNSNPQTLPQDPTGYVKPAGRAVGGSITGNGRVAIDPNAMRDQVTAQQGAPRTMGSSGGAAPARSAQYNAMNRLQNSAHNTYGPTAGYNGQASMGGAGMDATPKAQRGDGSWYSPGAGSGYTPEQIREQQNTYAASQGANSGAASAYGDMNAWANAGQSGAVTAGMGNAPAWGDRRQHKSVVLRVICLWYELGVAHDQ